MVRVGEQKCPSCSGKLKYFDRVYRIVRTKYRKTEWIDIRRLKYIKCEALDRELH